MVRMHVPQRLKSFQGTSQQEGSSNSQPPSRSHSPAPTSAGRSPNAQLTLRVNVIKGRDLAAKDKGGSSDPYLVLILGDARQSTVSIPKTLNPEWNETIDLPISGLQNLLLEVVCWDKDRFGKDYMGEFEVVLEDMFSNGKVEKEPTWNRLESRRGGKKKAHVTGEVLLGFSIFDPQNLSATPQQIQQKLLGIAANAPELDGSDDVEGSISRTNSLETDDVDDDDDTAPEEGSDDLQSADAADKQKKRRRVNNLRRKAKQSAYEFRGSTNLDGVLFLEISRISDLPPERNMTRTSFDMDPFVITSLGKRTVKTKVIRHSLNPTYEEKFVFQVFKHEVTYSVNFTVVDRDKLSGNDFIGTANFPVEGVQAVAPEADPSTGLYKLRSPELYNNPTSETKKSRFRLPLSRSSSATNLQRTISNGRPQLQSSLSKDSVQSRGDNSSLDVPGSDAEASTQNGSNSATSTSAATSTRSNLDDPDLNAYILPITLKNKDRWEDKHKPTLYIKAKYLPYRALRQQFWRAMLKQYDVDDSGYMSKVELTTMLDTLGSTLRESTIDGFFERFQNHDSGGELCLSFDQAVMCLEDMLQKLETQRKASHAKKLAAKASGARTPVSARGEGGTPPADTGSSTPAAPTNEDPTSTLIPTISKEHADERAEEGETLDTEDLVDDRGEEHVIEIQECPICHQPRMKKRREVDIITHIATCASQDWRGLNNIVMAGFVTSSQAQRKWYSKVVTKIGYGGYKLGANSANILVQDRITGQINEERMSVYVRLGIRLLYKGLKSRDMEKKRIRKLLRNLSLKQGRKYDDPASASEIQSFINFHRLDMSEVKYKTEDFKNFNEFFYRELKPDARPCSAPDRPEIITSPADCRSVVFNQITEAQKIWVKGRDFTLERLFGDAYPGDVQRFKGGSLGIFRLAPQDYHRFHIPVDGVMEQPKTIEGEYYTVNPMAIRSALDVYGENVRVLVPINSTNHGRVMVVCVGAMMVGSTVITRNAGDKVSRAEELGYFKFGGSTILLLFEPGMMYFDNDIVDNSNLMLETLIRVGMSIGHAPDVAPHTPDMRKSAEDVTLAEKQEAKRRIEGSLAPDAQDDMPVDEHSAAADMQ